MKIRELYEGALEVFRGRDRCVALALLGLIVASSLWETLGVASIGPFLAVISNPEVHPEKLDDGLSLQDFGCSRRQDLRDLSRNFDSLDRSVRQCAGVVYALGGVPLHFRSGLPSRAAHVEHLSRSAYAFFLENNSIDLARNVYDEVPRAISGVVLPLFYVIARGVTVVLIVGLLVYMDKFVAMMVLVFFAASYLLPVQAGEAASGQRSGRQLQKCGHRRFVLLLKL